MKRLTEHYNDYMRVVGCSTLYGPRMRAGAYTQNSIVRLANIEDILYAPDGAERITIDRLRELVQADSEKRVVVLPCKVRDTVYVITKCENVSMSHDDDWETGTGAVECPFENSCNIEDCDDFQIRIFETVVTGFMVEEGCACGFHTFFEHVYPDLSDDCWGKTVFLNRTEAEAALAKKEG